MCAWPTVVVAWPMALGGRNRMKLGWLFIVLATMGCAYEADYLDTETNTVPVHLRISNASTDVSLRCLLSMAHFITRDLAPIAGGSHADLNLHRGVKSRTLYYKEGTTPLMAIENIYCGMDRAWAETKNNLNIAALRSENKTSHHVVCTSDNGLICLSQNGN